MDELSLLLRMGSGIRTVLFRAVSAEETVSEPGRGCAHDHHQEHQREVVAGLRDGNQVEFKFHAGLPGAPFQIEELEVW